VPNRSILQLGNPILRQKCAPVEDFSSPQLQSLIRDLDDTLAQFRRIHNFGRGIAAPQIGELTRVIFIRMVPSGFCGSLLNPRIVWQSSERKEIWDSCFSFPDLVVKVSRAAEIKIEYQDETAMTATIEASGDLSELLQHEIDHLDGILAIDRALSSHSFMTRSEWKRQQSA
jgi:peptide deformylase